MAAAKISTGGSKVTGEFFRRHPVASYSLMAYAISWIGSILVAGPKFLRGESMDFADLGLMGLMMFAGPSVAGISMTYLMDGRSGLSDLLSRARRWRARPSWWAVSLLLPPVLILLVLFSLSIMVSWDYFPGFFTFGIVLGMTTGFFEEIGWIGFLYPVLRKKRTSFNAAIIVGLIHGVWHFTATYIGASQWLGSWFAPYFASMWIIAMTAMRVLQVWVYNNTSESVLLIQLMHGSSTGFLLVFTPTYRLPSTETLWFFVYAVVLWIVVTFLVRRYGTSLMVSTEGSPEFDEVRTKGEYHEYETTA